MDTATGVADTVVLVHQFVMEIVPLLVGLSLEKLLQYQHQLC